MIEELPFEPTKFQWFVFWMLTLLSVEVVVFFWFIMSKLERLER